MFKKIKNWIKKNLPLLSAFIKIFHSRIKDFIPYRLRRYNNYGFHNDRVLLEFVSTILRLFPISAFIETGTYKGDTTLYVKNIAKNLLIFTCEISKKFFRESSWRFRGINNIKIFNGSSPDFLRDILSKKAFGDLPLFFLDAHADEFYWPLLDEVEIISQKFKKAIIIIDDFEVPGRNDFGYDIWRNGNKEIIYNFDAIKSRLGDLSRYNFLYPDYAINEAFPNKDLTHDPLRGYIIMFKDSEKEFAIFMESPLVKKYVRPKFK